MTSTQGSAPKSGRIEARFAALKRQGRAGLVAFVTAGDPDRETSREILLGLPEAGADIVELGMPFTDPMADGPSIQASGLRALKAGARMERTLELARDFRARHAETPLILMGYFNPILSYGVERFIADSLASGVDGLIVVDLPPEEDKDLCLPAKAAGLRFIRFATPTTDEARLPKILANASGFIYYVSITGVTGAQAPDQEAVRRSVTWLQKKAPLPIAVGFGIRTREQANAIGQFADAVVVGSALVDAIAKGLDETGRARPNLAKKVLGVVRDLASGMENKA